MKRVDEQENARISDIEQNDNVFFFVLEKKTCIMIFNIPNYTQLDPKCVRYRSKYTTNRFLISIFAG